MNEPSKLWATEPTLFSAVSGVRQLQTHVTVDTPFHWAAVGQHGAVRLSRLSWAGSRLHADCLSLPGSDSAGRGVRAAHLYLAGRFDRDMEGPWNPYDVVPLQRVESCRCQESIIACFIWMVYRLISIHCFWKSSKIGPGGHPLWWPVRGRWHRQAINSWRSQQAQIITPPERESKAGLKSSQEFKWHLRCSVFCRRKGERTVCAVEEEVEWEESDGKSGDHSKQVSF